MLTFSTSSETREIKQLQRFVISTLLAHIEFNLTSSFIKLNK